MNNHTDRSIPIPTLHLFPVLDNLLIQLLKSLKKEEWHAPTIAILWTVKDIAAHLLDGNLRTLSFSRDGYTGQQLPPMKTYDELVSYLNKLNADWIQAAKRLSPEMLTTLLETTGPLFHQHLQNLSPFGNAIFPVAWAGQERSPNWFHIAREYTEKFIHQQQIREAVGKQALFTRELFHPFIDTCMQALPNAYRHVAAATGTLITVTIPSEIGGSWCLIKRENGWQLIKATTESPVSILQIPAGTAWKLFSKGISPEQAQQHVTIEGDQRLAEPVLKMVTVMA